MPLQEIDISWQLLRRIVRHWLGTSAEVEQVKPLTGGCINTTLALRIAGGRRAVLKISPHRVNRLYEQEAYQLNLLGDMGLPVPEIYACHIGSLDEPHSYLMMEHIEGVDLSEAKRRCNESEFEHLQMHLAELVATMHRRTAAHYKRAADGATDGHKSWPAFYHEVYDPIWQQVRPAVPPRVRKVIDKTHDRLDKLLAHADRPRLVHWDLWATNLLAAPDSHGKWWITAVLDPNCKYAHSEAEIAYLELFKTTTPGFLRAYQQCHKLDADYRQVRRPIYQLYPLLNHVQLFGKQYLKPLLEATKTVSEVV